MPPVLPPFRPDTASATRFLFFTGKGGVGKTSLSSATALRLADAGRRVLLVSTDPASNLDEVLGLPLDRTPRDVPGAPGLQAMNINPMEAAAAYRERVVGPMRGLLPDDVLRGMEEQLSGSCTIEIAAFDEFAALLGYPDSARAFDHVVFDTAPTGHTLRLMSLAGAWDRFLDGNTSGASCLGPLAGLERQRAVYETAVRTLSDETQTTLVLVTRPQTGAMREAERTSAELRAIGVTRQLLVVNGVFHAATPDDPVAAAMHARADAALRAAEGFLTSLPAFAVPLRASNVLGLARLRDLLQDDAGPSPAHTNTEAPTLPASLLSLGEWIDRLPRPARGVILTMGKGGVGKTTVAAAIATALAHRGVSVHLTTTDPAAHIRDTLLDGANDLAPDALPLTVGSINPAAETEAYRREVLATAGRDLDAASRALLEEDLRSPCTEEIAVFRAFAREVARGGERLVVLDTAPTGHTLLLLDATQSHHRELVRQARADHPPEVLHLLARLRDPAYTRVLLVTLPEATPVHEAAALRDDLRRAGIEPAAWVVNQGLPGCGSADPLLRARAESERRYLGEVAAQHARETIFIPWQLREPRGLAALLDLSNATPNPDPAMSDPKPSVLILCTGNSCRSHMAEGILRAAAGDLLDVHSAGSKPAGYVHPKAIAALAEIGIDISGHTSKHMNDFLDRDIHTVITVCGNADQVCPMYPGQVRRHHWGFFDPAHATGTDEEIMAQFRVVRDEIRRVFEAYAEGWRSGLGCRA